MAQHGGRAATDSSGGRHAALGLVEAVEALIRHIDARLSRLVGCGWLVAVGWSWLEGRGLGWVGGNGWGGV